MSTIGFKPNQLECEPLLFQSGGFLFVYIKVSYWFGY